MMGSSLGRGSRSPFACYPPLVVMLTFAVLTDVMGKCRACGPPGLGGPPASLMGRGNVENGSGKLPPVARISLTTVRDVGGATHFLKRMVDDGVIIGPRLKIAICMLSTTGGHADFRGPDRCHGEVSRLWPPGPGRPSSIVDGPWECRKRVREVAACGADFVKICASPGVVSPSDKLEHRDFTQEEIEAICDEAAGRGLSVAAHAHSKRGVALSIDCGVQDIQHISFMDEGLAERAYAKGCTVTPTSWISRSLPHASGLSPFVMEKVRQVAEVHSQAVRIAHGSGLKILAGTDPVLPNMHGLGMDLGNLPDLLHHKRTQPTRMWHCRLIVGFRTSNISRLWMRD